MPIVSGGSGGGTTNQSDLLWQRTFWADSLLLPATSFLERLETFGSFTFEDSRVTLTKDATMWRSGGVNAAETHFAFDTGAQRSKLFFLIGISGYGANTWGPYMSDATTNADGDTTGNSYHFSSTSAGSWGSGQGFYKQTAGVYGGGPNGTQNIAAFSTQWTGFCLIFDGAAHTQSMWARLGDEQWWPLGRWTDASFSTMRMCGVRAFTNVPLVLAAPVVIYYT